MKDFNLRAYLAEFIGTFILVFFGTGSAVLYSGASANALLILTVPIVFGLTIVAVYYSIGHISGGHVNPAVSLAMYFDNRISLKDMFLYMFSQLLGALSASALLFALISNIPNAELKTVGLGANGFEKASLMNITLIGAFLTEIILTGIFVFVVLSVSKKENYSSTGGLAIGSVLTLVHFFGIALTGTSVNPARSLAPAIILKLVGLGTALNQVWLFIIAPLLGAVLAVTIYKLMTNK
ncbi:MIP/aquaporin family protein [Eggerthia catenaformis]|uniref:MIP/aquaporin family protein n=1 Tax=Eggerthia catenaformis TaxID=31973 RepID=UPI003C6F7048